MTTYTGNGGVVKVTGAASNATIQTIGEVRSFTFRQAAEDGIEDTALGDTSRSYKSGSVSASGTVECHFDDDNAGQTALDVGTTVALELYPLGTASGGVKYAGNVNVTNLEWSVAYDEIIGVTFSWDAAGAITRTAID